MSAGFDPQFEEVSDVGKRATTDQYDEHGNIIANNSVPLPDPKFRPESGDVATSPEQLNASAPPAPATPDPYGGSVSASRADPDLSSEQNKELRSTDERKGMQVFPENAEKHDK
ncbi:MAG TPA: hypothetical protein VF510_13360 [Ktedonobacterales bacterium]